MPSASDPTPAPSSHRYPLFDGDRPAGVLVWRSQPRQYAGWFVLPHDGAPRRLEVDPAVDELAADRRSDEPAWELHAELAAILSTSMALDAAERTIHDRPHRHGGRFRRLTADGYEIYVKNLTPEVLGRTVPELAVSSVSDVVVLEGRLLADAVPVILRRLALLGGSVVAVLTAESEDG
jgi:hypothetical protein